MLGDSEAIATIAVKDLTVARKFYEGTLGLEVARATGSEALTFKTGRSELIVYRSQYAGSNKATAVNWRVGDEIETDRQGARGQGGRLRALRPAGPDPEGRRARLRRVQVRLVQRPRRQHHRAHELLAV